MMSLGLRGTCVLTLVLGVLHFSAATARSGGTGVCCDPGGCQDGVGGCSTGTFINNTDCSADPCCDDGTCAADEDSCSCPDDCSDDPDSCSTCECGGQSSGGCWCDTSCFLNGDCCFDVCDDCPCCGDTTCDPSAGEDHCNCPQDCADPDPFLCDPCECGGSSSDGTCYCDDLCTISGDCCENACDECGFCSVCGDGTCSIDENCSSCPDDCLACGDGSCDFLCEDNCSCPEDCSACGDGFCDTVCEDCNNCPGDCVCGACCTGPDNCQVTLEVDCSGEYQGDGTFCEVDTCAPPTGACCIDNQACSEARANECNAGTYQGDGTTCSPDPCDRQCCFSDGGCQNLAEADCNSQGGTPGAAGSNCSTNSCPQPTGACVTAGGVCTETTQAECFDNSGTFLGPGTSCGACCMSDGSCMETSEADCSGSFAGTYQGDDTFCVDVTCPQPPTGACCSSSPIGSPCSEVSESACTAGFYAGDGTTCTETACNGACCSPVTGCTEGPPSDCIIIAIFQGIGTTCAEVDCGGGACCTSTGCVDVASDLQCLFSLFGDYQGDGTDCASITCPPPTGACCLPNGDCDDTVDASTCIFLGGGDFQGMGTTCDPDPCALLFGACCTIGTGICNLTDEAGCDPSTGFFRGLGTTCTDGACDGACCLPSGMCDETDATTCIALGGGDFQGIGTTCDPDPCALLFGACCTIGTGICDLTDEAGCDPSTGFFRGLGTTCTEDACDGACCLPSGMCDETDASTCIFLGGGDFQGIGTTCNPDPCPEPTGACCFPSGECTGETTETDCQSQGGAYQGDGSLCGSSVPNCPQPPTGACCFSGSCSELSEAGCADVGGTYQGDSTVCDTNTCQPEACCFFGFGGGGFVAGTSVGDCEPMFSADCLTAGGLPQGTGSVCDPNPCVAPCCFIDGSCSILNPDVCFTMGGITQPPGGTCDPNTCPAPACCLSGGGCEHIPVADCVANGGTPRSPAELCSAISCAAIGACCYEGKGTGCVEVTASECTNTYQGVFQGDNTVCTPDPCPAANECVNQPVGTACGVDDNNACTSVCTLEGVCGIDCDDNNACTIDSCDPSAGCQHAPISCQDNDPCTADTCDALTGCVHEPACGACCLRELNGNVAGPVPTGCIDTFAVTCEKGLGGEFQGLGTSCASSVCNPHRVDISTKGSLLIFSNVELAWSPGTTAGFASTLKTDTVISLINDYPGEVYVQMYFVNGDPELDPVFVGTPPTLVREGEPGWNWVDCQLLLTPDQPMYWSAATGSPAGCQPFDILDPDLGSGPGRPNPDAADGSRVLRGFIVAWAVDEFGREVNWNHLSGKATIVDYAAQTAWEYDAWAVQALAPSLIDQGVFSPGILRLDGVEYEQLFDILLYDFFAAGSQALSADGSITTVDGELTLHVVSADLRQESEGPITTKAHFDIWNMNERKLSNTRRCLTCWDQALLSTFNAPNSFLLANLQSDKGKARIDGKQADECEENCFRDPMGNPLPVEDLLELLGDLFGDVDVVCSQDAALLGVATKILTFSGPAGQRAVAGSPLVGMGFEPAVIQYDIIDPPGTLRDDAFQRIGRTPPRTHERLDIETKKQRN